MPKEWKEELKAYAGATVVEILQEYGPLSILVYSRVERLSKDDFDMFDLSIVNI